MIVENFFSNLELVWKSEIFSIVETFWDMATAGETSMTRQCHGLSGRRAQNCGSADLTMVSYCTWCWTVHPIYFLLARLYSWALISLPIGSLLNCSHFITSSLLSTTEIPAPVFLLVEIQIKAWRYLVHTLATAAPKNSLSSCDSHLIRCCLGSRGWDLPQPQRW